MKTFAKTDATGIIENWQQMPEAQDLPEGVEVPAAPDGWVELAAVQTQPIMIGAKLVLGVIQAKPQDPRMWWIDVGPFKDRLGIDGMALSASTNATCQAIKEQLYDRKYVDLKSTQTAQLLGMLMAAVQPVANASFPGAGPITALKIAAITGTPTTEAERHIKGLS